MVFFIENAKKIAIVVKLLQRNKIGSSIFGLLKW